MKNVLDFIKKNPITEDGEYYNMIGGMFGKFKENKSIDHIYVGNSYEYFVMDGFLYAENNETGKHQKRKI